MKYRKVSFFDKYNINPELDFSKLMMVFQTDPSKRKDLPVVIQIIKDKSRLFEEELYTKHNSSDELFVIHSNLLTSVENVLNNISRPNIKNLNENISLFKENKGQIDKFYYAKSFKYDEISNIINNFIESILEEIYSKVLFDLEKIEGDVLVSLIEFFDSFNDKYVEKLEDSISSKIDSFMLDTSDSDTLKENLKFLSLLPKNIFERENIYKSYLFFIDKNLNKNEDIDFINENYKSIMKLAKESEIEKYASLLVKISNGIVDLKNDKKISYTKLKKQGELLVDNYIFYIQNSSKKDYSIEEKLEQSISILDCLLQDNTTWKEYCNAIELVKKNPSAENIYNYVEIVIKAGFNKTTYKLFSATIISITNFNIDLMTWADKNERLNKVVKELEGSVNRITYAEIASIPNLLKGINSASDVDDFLCKYYCLHYFDDSILPNNAINNLKASAFSLLEFMSCANEWYMNNTGDGNLTYRGMFLKEVLIRCPSDWEIGGTTVKNFLSNNFGYYTRSNYGESKFKGYENKYSSLFYRANKYIVIHDLWRKLNVGKQAKDNYSKAISLMENSQYEKAQIAFIELGEYKDSASKAKECLEKIMEEKYKNAKSEMKSKNYQKAYDQFVALGKYKDSASKAKECLEEISKEKYEKAEKLFENQEYYKAYEAFLVLGTYKDSKKKAKITLEKFESSTYEIANNLMKQGKYEEAIKEFNKILSYKDSNSLVKECETLIYEKTYQEALKYYENEKYESANILFKQISKYKDSKKYISLCENKIREIENDRKYSNAKKYIYDYEKTKSTFSLKYAIGILSELAKIDYKDSRKLKLEYELELDRIAKKRKILIINIIAAIFALFISLIIINVREYNKERDRERHALYTELQEHMSTYDGTTNNAKIKRIFEKLPNDYLDVEKYENKYNFIRSAYLINDIDNILNNDLLIEYYLSEIPKNYPGLSDLKDLYDKNKETKAYEIYQLLVQETNNYTGESSNAIIKKYLDILPSNYRNVSTLSNQFETVISIYNSIKTITDKISNSESDSNTLRKNLISLYKLDYNSSYWDFNDYIKSVNISKVIFGNELYSKTYKYEFHWYKNSLDDLDEISYILDSERPKISGKTYYYKTEYDSENNAITFSLHTDRYSYPVDTIGLATFSNLSYDGDELYVSYYNFKDKNTYKLYFR